jgi:uncharacterized protein YqhQ
MIIPQRTQEGHRMLLKRILATARLTTRALLLPALSAESKVGGQAIIEGVMMRGKKKVSWAVKKANGEVAVESEPFTSLSQKYKLLSKPVLRGFVSLIESLSIGLKALSRSAELAAEEAPRPAESSRSRSIKDSLANFSSIAFAFVLSFGIFLYLPLKVISFVVDKESALLYNLLAGGVRVVFFLIYLYLISLWKDIQRVFEFHGAEHKAIFTFEAGKELTIDNMKGYTTFHPRCGTSFLLLVALICIAIFAVIDALIIHFIGPYPSVLVRTLTHVVLIPIVSGTSYEVLRFSDRYQHTPEKKWFIQPGLWLQRITTREPDDEQLEIASKALKAAI